MGQLNLSFLGPWQVTSEGEAVTGFKYDKVRALLAYISVEADRPHPREVLTGLLWPELPESAARNNLRQVLGILRQAIGDHTAAPPFLFISRADIQFNSESSYELDVLKFTELIAACRRHPHRNPASCKTCAGRLQAAAALYRGPFLAEFFLPDSAAFEAWAQFKREWLQQQMLETLDWLTTYYERRAQYDLARQTARRQLELEPWREAAHRQLMRLQMLSGDRSAALAQYEKCCHVLNEELGVEPEAETAVLYEQIRDASDEKPTAWTQLALPTIRPHTLPPSPTPFIGRENELATIAQRLDEPGCRLLTLVGPGGVGKTRLALQAAAESLDAFADGIFFVPLASLDSADLLASTIAAAIGLETGTADSQTALLDYLRGKELLILLDNYEHLLPHTDLLAAVLHHAPDVTLLLTSRERLNLQGEWLLDVNGMPVPAHSTAEPERSDAVQLFVQNARRVRPDFALTPQNRSSVFAICQLMEGLPLALELAASWVRVLSCSEIAAEVERSITFLTTSLRDVPQRHQSITAVFDHSWRLLTSEEQAVMQRLALFRGGFRRAAAVEVATTTLPVLAALVDKSMLRHQVTGRYALHELLRQFAAEKLSLSGVEGEANQKFAAYYRNLAETAEPHLTGGEQQAWLTRLGEEHDNIRAVLTWALNEGDTDTAAHIGSAIWRFWQLHGHIHEGRAWLARILAAEPALPPQLRAKTLKGAGVLAWYQSDYAQAAADFETSLNLYRELDDRDGIAHLTNNLGVLALHRARFDEAIQLLEQSLQLRRELGDTWGMATCLNNLGAAAGRLGDRQKAAAYYEESLVLSRELGNRVLAAMLLTNLGDVAVEEGDRPKAQSLYEESLSLRRQLGEKVGIGYTLMRLAGMAYQQQNHVQAYRYYAESLDLFDELGDREHLVYCLEGIAEVAAAAGLGKTAASLWGTAESVREQIGIPLPPARQAELQQQQAAARGLMDENTWQQAWLQGQTFSLEEAVNLARKTSQNNTFKSKDRDSC